VRWAQAAMERIAAALVGGKIVAIVPPRGNMAAGVAADAPGGAHLGKIG
jgi:hypothetical protein